MLTQTDQTALSIKLLADVAGHTFFDDRFGALQPLFQPEVVPPSKGELGRQWVRFDSFGAALDRAQRFEGAGGAQTTPIRQGRGVKLFAAHDRADPSEDASGAVGLPEDPQFVLRRERAATRTLGKFRRGGGRRKGLAVFDWGHNHGMFVLRPQG